MEKNYLCPLCNSYLRVRENIILAFKTGQKKGIILLNPQLGNYNFILHHTIKFDDSEKVDFFCPICSRNLAANEINENLVRINMNTSDGKSYDIYFSRIVGEQTTFKIEANNVIEKFGKDSSSYLNYFSSKLEEHLNK